MNAVYQAFEDLVKINLPADSEITGTEIVNAGGNVFACVYHILSEEYARENEILYRERVMRILLVRANGYCGLPVESFYWKKEEK